MKDQYFGDEHDFRKYTLLKFLQQSYEKIAVNWMKTPDELTTHQNDGNKRNYEHLLENDEDIYRILQTVQKKEQRTVENFLVLGILKDPLLWSKQIPDSDVAKQEGKKLRDLRSKWFEDFKKISGEAELIFFDPDNGLEVRSVSKGSKNSCKYLYLDELRQVFFEQEQDILFYQHRPREKLPELIREKCRRLTELESNAPMRKKVPPLIFTAGGVLYFLLLHSEKKRRNIESQFRQQQYDKDFLSIYPYVKRKY